MVKKAIFEKRNVLVTGGAGFIGSHLCDELVKKNKVICIDDFSSGNEKNIDHLLQNPNFAFIKHDINQPINLEELRELAKFKIQFQGIQEIYHLAVPTTPNTFEQDKMAIAWTNSTGTRNMLDLAVKYKAKFLLSSSSVVYGPRDSKIKFFQEDYQGSVNQIGSRAAYDEGKRFAETLTVTYRDVYGLDTKIARIFRTYGTRMELSAGHMVPDFIYNALENKDLVIYGDDKFSSSFCHITDMVQALTKMMKKGEPGPINLGSDSEMKIVDIAKTIIKITGSKSKIVYKKPLLFMTPLGLPDISRARERLGWFPIVLFDQGIGDAIDYFRAHKSIVGPTGKKN